MALVLRNDGRTISSKKAKNLAINRFDYQTKSNSPLQILLDRLIKNKNCAYLFI